MKLMNSRDLFADLLMISRTFMKSSSPATICGVFQRLVAHYSLFTSEQLSQMHFKFRNFTIQHNYLLNHFDDGAIRLEFDTFNLVFIQTVRR